MSVSFQPGGSDCFVLCSLLHQECVHMPLYMYMLVCAPVCMCTAIYVCVCAPCLYVCMCVCVHDHAYTSDCCVGNFAPGDNV